MKSDMLFCDLDLHISEKSSNFAVANANLDTKLNF